MTRAAARVAVTFVAAAASAVAAVAAGPPPPPDYAAHVEPLVRARCVPCHRDGGVAPFSLAGYDNARRRARLIAAVTAVRYMPPWKPDAGWGEFEDERRLSDEEIALLQAWVEAGAPPGDLDTIPPLPSFPDGWRLGEPDLVVTPGAPFPLGADGGDVFRSFVLSIPEAAGRTVRGIELSPGNPRVVHHATVYADATGAARQLDELDPLPGYDGMEVGTFPGGHFFGWTPGHTPRLLDDGMGWVVPEGTDLIVETHLLPSGRPEAVRPRLGLHFADEPPRLHPVTVRLGATTIDLPPGIARHVVEDTFVLPVDVRAYALYPHAHFLCRTIEARAVLPDGTERRLIRIGDWDFNWQDEYRYREPVALPAGTRLEARWVYDNSAANVRNPHDPPRRVRWGPRSTDEMAELWLRVLPVDPGETDALRAALRRRDVGLRVAGFEARLEADPDDVDAASRLGQLMLLSRRMERAVELLERAKVLRGDAWHVRYNLGVALTHLGRVERAIPEFEAALALKPDRPRIHSNLGVALLLAGRDADAERVFGRAVESWPGFVEARTNHGVALARLGRLEEAVAAYRAALATRPDYPEAHANLGSALIRLGRHDEAEISLRRALELRPGDPDPLKNLALVATARGEAAVAAGLLERAVRASPRDVDAHLMLAESLAALGRRDEAKRRLEAAAALAPGNPSIEALRRRLEDAPAP